MRPCSVGGGQHRLDKLALSICHVGLTWRARTQASSALPLASIGRSRAKAFNSDDTGRKAVRRSIQTEHVLRYIDHICKRYAIWHDGDASREAADCAVLRLPGPWREHPLRSAKQR